MPSLALASTQFLGLELQNHIGRSAVATMTCDDDGHVTDRTVELYRGLAAGRLGMVIVEHSYVHPRGRAHKRQMSISRDDDVEGHRRMLTAMREADPRVKVTLQLAHAGAQGEPEPGYESACPTGGIELPNYNTSCRAFTAQELREEVVPAFVAAARRAEEAGYDAVQLHMAHGYLMSEFLSPALNRREDEFGQDRALLSCLVTEAVTRAVAIPVYAKIGVDHIEGSATPELLGQQAVAIARAGLRGFEISGGCSVAPREFSVSRTANNAPFYNRDGFEGVRAALDAAGLNAVDVAVVGGFRALPEVEEALAIARPPSVVFLGRALIRQPDLVRSWADALAAGEDPQVSKCRSCNGCLSQIHRGKSECPFRARELAGK